MAKRGADVQINKDHPGDSDDNGSWGATSGPQKATAAQLAARRIAQPRGGPRRPASAGARRPLPAPSPVAVNGQQQIPAFGQANGIPQSHSAGFTFGQKQQPPASASFPQFGNNNTGNSSTFTPPSSSFSFGSQLSSNPFAPSTTSGSNKENKSDPDKTNNLFLQSDDVVETEAKTASTNIFSFTPPPPSKPGEYGSKGRRVTATTKEELPVIPKSAAAKTPVQAYSYDEAGRPLDEEGKPLLPSGPGRPANYVDPPVLPPPPPPPSPTMAKGLMPPPPLPDKALAGLLSRSSIVFQDSAPPSKPGTFGTSGRTIPPFAQHVDQNPPQAPQANDDMDTEASPSALIPAAPAVQNMFAGFGTASPATHGMFGNNNGIDKTQGQNSFSFSPQVPLQAPTGDVMDGEYTYTHALTPCTAHNPHEMGVVVAPYLEANIDSMDTEEMATPAGQGQTPFTWPAPQVTSNMFANAGNTASSTFPFAQPTASSQQQNPPSTFAFGQPNTSSQPQQNSSSTFSFGQALTPASTQPQQNPTTGFGFGQPNMSTEVQQNSDSDAMMISPEKNRDAPLGRSLFDRAERPPIDASSSPATTSTAPPPTFSFGRNVSSATSGQGGLFGSVSTSAASSTPSTDAASSEGGLFQEAAAPATSSMSDIAAVSGQGGLFGRVTPPAASSIGQNTVGDVSQPSDTPRASSPTKEGRLMAVPRKHVEDKPNHHNPFASIIMPKDQPSSSSAAAPSSFSPKPKDTTTSTSDAPSSGGLFGSLTNKNAQSIASPFKSFNNNTEAQKTSNLFKASGANHGTSNQSGSNIFLPSTTNTGTSSPIKHLEGTLPPSSASHDVSSKEARSPLKPSSVAQNNGGQHASTSTKSANGTTNTPPTHEQSVRDEGRYSQPLFPPGHFSAEEKKEYYSAWAFKFLEVGAEAKRKRLVLAAEKDRMKTWRKLCRAAERNIREADGGPVMPVAKRRRGFEESDTQPKPKRVFGDQGNHYFKSAAPVAAGKRKADNEAGHDQEQESSGIGKRARGDHGDQVNYPSLTASGPSSNTSSMFKNILDKPAAMTNGVPSNNSPSSPSKPSESVPSLFNKSINNKDMATQAASNPFAAGIANFRATNSPSPDSVSTKPTNISPSLFTFKPTTNNVDASSTPKAASIQPPTFGGSAAPANFLAQFGKKAQEDELKKRKAEDMDSDEEEAEWERRDAEEQRAKKQKMEEALAKQPKLVPRFDPNKGFSFVAASDNDEAVATPGTQTSDSHVSVLDEQHADFAKKQAPAANAVNPFAKFLKPNSGNGGSRNEDADDEEERSDEDAEQAPAAKESMRAGLFNRITSPSSETINDADKDHPSKASGLGVNMFGQVAGAAASVSGSNAAKKPPSERLWSMKANDNPFGKLPSSTPSQNVFGTPSSAKSPNAPGSGEKGDNTWKPESPIKFGGDAVATGKNREHADDDTRDGQVTPKKVENKDAPAVNITSPSPSKAPLGSLFGIPKPNASTETPTKANSNATAPTPAGSLGSAFGFGISPIKPAPTLGSLFPPSSNASNGVSRSTSPGATTGESATESNADGDDEGAEKHEQIDLTSGGPGEEDEDILYEARAKVVMWVENDGAEKGAWETKGLGPFRIMKNRETGKARMLMRSDPAGRVIINSSIFKQFKYDAPSKNTCRVPMLSADQKLETWVIKIGKDKDAADIAKILEENKD